MKRKRSADAAPAHGTGTALSLTVAGALTLVTAFVLLNDWFGVHVKSWPWDFFTDGDQGLRVRALYGLVFVTALWALALSFTKAHRLRSTVLIALVAVLSVECARYMHDIGIATYDLYTLILLTGIGAGLLLAREEGTRGMGRILVGVAVVAFVWDLASLHGPEQGSLLETWWRDITMDLGDYGANRPDDYLWVTVLPRSLFLVAGACGLLAAFGVRHRLFLLIAFWLVAAGLLARVGYSLIHSFGQDGGAQAITDESVTALVQSGFLLWLLGTYALYDAARGRVRES